MRVVFMGTPAFAVPSLERIVESSHDIVLVITPPDRPKGRGLRVASSPVKEAAESRNLPIYQPEGLKSTDFLGRLSEAGAECYVVVGFRILPPEVFEIPPRGTINLHASLLPAYRGAAPIQWALMNGETRTGVTTFFIEKRVDTGNIILQHAVDIGDGETAGELHDRLAVVGADLLVETLDRIASGNTARTPQEGKPTRAPKILPEHCRIDWQRPAEEIVNQVRGLSPRPGAFTVWKGRRVKIIRARVSDDASGASSGEVVSVSDEGIAVKAAGGTVLIREIQPEGKRYLEAAAFLRGSTLSKGTILGR
jgi:methionyl-tRNA formyltransferase